MAKSPLFKKLRMQPGQRALIMNAPPGYLDELGDLPEGVALADEPEGIFFFDTQEDTVDDVDATGYLPDIGGGGEGSLGGSRVSRSSPSIAA